MEQNNESNSKQTNQARQFVILLLIAGVVPAFVSLFLRIFTAGEHEIKTVDLVLIVIPFLFAALVTGKLTSLDLFGVKVYA